MEKNMRRLSVWACMLVLVSGALPMGSALVYRHGWTLPPGTSIPIPFLSLLTGEADAECTKVATDDDHCDAEWGPAVGYQDLETLWVVYCDNNCDPAFRTTGSDKNYIKHWHAPDDVHTAVTWLVNYRGGSALSGPEGDCSELQDHPGYEGTGSDGWHGQKLTGFLTADTGTFWQNGNCWTGAASGYFGAGVAFE
jgi:hypothetical protein